MLSLLFCQAEKWHPSKRRKTVGSAHLILSNLPYTLTFDIFYKEFLPLCLKHMNKISQSQDLGRYVF